MQVGYLAAGLALRGRHLADKRKARTVLESAGSLSAPAPSIIAKFGSLNGNGRLGPVSQFCDVSSLSCMGTNLRMCCGLCQTMSGLMI
jgi:hypothetical protein